MRRWTPTPAGVKIRRKGDANVRVCARVTTRVNAYAEVYRWVFFFSFFAFPDEIPCFLFIFRDSRVLTFIGRWGASGDFDLW